MFQSRQRYLYFTVNQYQIQNVAAFFQQSICDRSVDRDIHLPFIVASFLLPLVKLTVIGKDLIQPLQLSQSQWRREIPWLEDESAASSGLTRLLAFWKEEAVLAH